MSFGISIGDGVLFSQLVLNALQGAKRAEKEYSELERQVSSLDIMLQLVKEKVSDSKAPPRHADQSIREQIDENVAECQLLLKEMYLLLTKYTILADDSKSWKKMLPKWWKKL
jgi:hypothetical protein